MASSEKLFACAFLLDVLCSYRKTEQFVMMAECFKCEYYVRFFREVDAEDAEEDAEFLAEQERLSKFARCLFEDCLCDGEHGKIACFGFAIEKVGDGAWKCRRFDVAKLKPDSAMREAYKSLVGDVVL